ncbi:MAG: gamma-glutamyl-gamma-aminobutyrate hydrolase family protein [Nitrospirae bacterium]|nr:gamma-glutamyl-gamma-aminobutyrate hydrolase family protein [Nitrospirota bacterium]
MSVSRAGGLPIVIPPCPKDEAGHIAALIDGLLLSGGGDLLPEYYGEEITVPCGCIDPVDKKRSDFEISLLKEMVREEKSVLAICYGMQIVNVAFGGSLIQDIKCQMGNVLDHSSGQHMVEILDKFYSYCGIQPSNTSNSGTSQRSVNSSHHQAVKRLGDGLEVFALAEDGIVEGFFKTDYPFLVGVQWHPERSFYDIISLALFETFIKKSQLRR